MSTPPPYLLKTLLRLVLVFIFVFAFACDMAAQTVRPAYMRFYGVNEGQSKTLTVALSNGGTSTVLIQSISSNHTWFTTSGVSLPYSLASGQSVPLNITFSPQGAQRVDANIVVANSGPGSPVAIAVHGTGKRQGWLAARPASLTFGNVRVGVTASQAVTVTNVGLNGLQITQSLVTGAGFTVTGLNLPVTLPPQNSLTFTVTFAPTSAGTATGNDALSYGNYVNSIRLGGTGTSSGQLTASPSPLTFGSVVVGNSQSAGATISAFGSDVTVTGASVDSPEFVWSRIAFPVTIAAGQSKTYAVTFTPQSSGSAGGNITFTSNASNSASEALAGSGTTSPAHNVTLTWSAGGSSIAGYNVYRGTQVGGTYARINTALDSATNFVDSNVQAGQTYFYAATSVGTDSVESQRSSPTEAVIPSP